MGPTKHSGQHLLSALAERNFSLTTVAWNLGPRVSCIELDLSLRPSSSPPTQSELDALEAKVNQHIRAGLPVGVEEVEGAGGEDRPATLPQDLVETGEGVVRYVSIEGVDRNPCCGTHVKTTAELQCLKLLHTERVRGKNLRLFFLFGDRVLSTFQDSLLRERAIGALLTTGPDQFVEKTAALQKQSKDAQRTLKTLYKELAPHLATQLATVAVPNNGPHHVIAYHRSDADADLLSLLATHLLDHHHHHHHRRSPPTTTPPRVYVLTQGETRTGGAAVVVAVGVGDEEGLVGTVWKAFVEACEGDVKGGGKAGKVQGKAVSWRHRAKACKAVGAVVVE
ncbi:Alanyl-tRNA editing protein Aarsd1 [Phlyctochytrium bullatum]|nr:Alanyl-tRNA editing protein Aarsd1 [Phlyctochytrium bullatum]